MLKNNIIVLDFETGGKDSKLHPITQVGLAVLEPKNLSIIDQYEAFVKPYNDLEITKKALEVSRVTMEEINAGIDYVKLIAKLIEIFRKHTPPNTRDARPILVGHNFSFDMSFGTALFELKNKNLYDFIDPVYYCTMRMMKMIDRKVKNDEDYTLTSCCSRFGIKLKSAHGAMHDVMATSDLFKAIWNSMSTEKGESNKSEVRQEQQKSRKFFEF